MKILLDDIREAHVGWLRVFWPDEIIALLAQGRVTGLNRDHDLGDNARGSGYDVLQWIDESVILRDFVPPRIVIRSANPVGRMLRCLAAIERLHPVASAPATALHRIHHTP